MSSFWSVFSGNREAEFVRDRPREDEIRDRERRRARQRQAEDDDARRARRARRADALSRDAPKRHRKLFVDDAEARRTERKPASSAASRRGSRPSMYQDDDGDDDEEEDEDDRGDEEDGLGRRRGGGDRGMDDGGDNEDEDGDRDADRGKDEEEENEQDRRKREDEEKRKAGMQENAKGMIPVYESSFGQSREKWASLWSMAKALAAIIIMVGAFFVNTFDYDISPCKTGDLRTQENANLCLKTDVLNNAGVEISCVGYEDDACRAACGLLSSGRGEGCLIEFLPGGVERANTSCYENDEFKILCVNSGSCSKEAQDDGINAVLLVGLVLFFMALVELLQGVGLQVYSNWHHEEFLEPTQKFGTFLIWATVNAPLAMQWLWVGGVLTLGWLAFVLFSVTIDCEGAETNTGLQATLFTDLVAFLVTLGAFLGGTMLVGSIFRHRVQLRGELFRPSADDAVRVPLGLDCVEPNSRPPVRCCTGEPRCCTSTWKDVCFPMACGKGCAYCCHGIAFFYDRVLCTPVLGCGHCLSWFFLHRHFLGP